MTQESKTTNISGEVGYRIYPQEQKVTILRVDKTGRPIIDGCRVPDTKIGREYLDYIILQISTGNPMYKLEDMR